MFNTSFRPPLPPSPSHPIPSFCRNNWICSRAWYLQTNKLSSCTQAILSFLHGRRSHLEFAKTHSTEGISKKNKQKTKEQLFHTGSIFSNGEYYMCSFRAHYLVRSSFCCMVKGAKEKMRWICRRVKQWGSRWEARGESSLSTDTDLALNHKVFTDRIKPLRYRYMCVTKEKW